jgi:hypothetical protein
MIEKEPAYLQDNKFKVGQTDMLTQLPSSFEVPVFQMIRCSLQLQYLDLVNGCDLAPILVTDNPLNDTACVRTGSRMELLKHPMEHLFRLRNQEGVADGECA